MATFSAKKPNNPVRVAYDILKMSGGGANGGIKTHHYEFLRHFTEYYAKKIELLVFCQSEIVEELKFLSGNPYNQIHVIGSPDDIDFRNSDGRNPPLHFWPSPPEQLLKKLEVDVLYAGFGDSALATPEIPQISLLVDVLHKDLPEMLPAEVVAQRDIDFKSAIAQADLIQTNSKFCVESLKKHYDIPEKKLFHIYLPLHGRFNGVAIGPLPTCLEGKKYFFYPANHWPHKNHEGLLVGFRKFLNDNSDSDWNLALTGFQSERTDFLKELSHTLGIHKRVHFLAHLQLEEHKAVWENAFALIFPSLYEGFGLPLIEAMYFQKPIACEETGPAKEIVGTQAILFNARKPINIAHVLVKLATEEGNEYDHSERLSQFDFNEQVKALIEAISSIHRINTK